MNNIHIMAQRWLKRNILWLFLIVILVVAAFGVGQAWADSPSKQPSGRVTAPNVGRVYREDFVSQTTTTTTTALPKKMVAAVNHTALVRTPSISKAVGSEECRGWAREAGVAEADLDNAMWLIGKESGCRVDAHNPSGAHGIPQALPGSKMASAGADYMTNPVTQIKWMIGYVNARYGGWAGACAHSRAHNWY